MSQNTQQICKNPLNVYLHHYISKPFPRTHVKSKHYTTFRN